MKSANPKDVALSPNHTLFRFVHFIVATFILCTEVGLPQAVSNCLEWNLSVVQPNGFISSWCRQMELGSKVSLATHDNTEQAWPYVVVSQVVSLQGFQFIAWWCNDFLYCPCSSRYFTRTSVYVLGQSKWPSVSFFMSLSKNNSTCQLMVASYRKPW